MGSWTHMSKHTHGEVEKIYYFLAQCHVLSYGTFMYGNSWNPHSSFGGREDFLTSQMRKLRLLRSFAYQDSHSSQSVGLGCRDVSLNSWLTVLGTGQSQLGHPAITDAAPPFHVWP